MAFEKYQYVPENPGLTIPTLSASKLSREIALLLYSEMVRIRVCEEALFNEYHPADEMRCPVHFCIGQEAVPAALSATFEHADYMYSHHRTHGFFLAKGYASAMGGARSMNALFAELYGKETGASGGLAGSQDISLPEARFYGGAILSGAIPIATGTALAAQTKGEKIVSVTGFGDGATDEGVFWEALNFAALKKLPVVFLCENNGYATFSPQRKRSSTSNIAERASTFGLPASTIFGNDATQTYVSVKEAMDRARNGGGPTLIEAYTYRWNGHVGPENDDVNNYRAMEELAFWKRHCPIALFEAKLKEQGYLSDADKERIYAEANAQVAGAFKFAKESKFPERTELESLNWSGKSPLADKLLKDHTSGVFDFNQKESIPAPY